MLPTKLTRAAHRATNTPSTAICNACLAAQRGHQRRHSSSKASSSADRYSNKPPAAKAGAPAAAEGDKAVAARAETPQPQRSSKGRARVPRRGSQDGNSKKAVTTEPVDQFAGLPSVPSVQSLSQSERSLSNFFSLHRPMSIHHTFPPPSTPETFNKIFSREPSQQDPWANGNSAERRPEDVIYTLNSTIETLENQANGAQDEGVRWEIIHESPSNQNQNNNNNAVHHLDGQPRLKNLEELVAQFKPFQAPPPPQPFAEYEEGGNPKQTKEKKAIVPVTNSNPAQPKQKTFTTTITITESTYANGRQTYIASSSPIVAANLLPEATIDTTLSTPHQQHQQQQRWKRTARLQRAHPNQIGEESGEASFKRLATSLSQAHAVKRTPLGQRGERVRRMYLISVKRQRKLKMKKHKYKKLMKRTRNLRRRLERN